MKNIIKSLWVNLNNSYMFNSFEHAYLSASIDLADFERRQRELERNSRVTLFNPGPYAHGG